VTPLDKALDRSLLRKESPLTLYRLTNRKYATSLSGLGAALYPGRWNAAAIYTSTERGVCVLERLVHTPKDRIPRHLALMTIHLSFDWPSSNDDLVIDRSTGMHHLSFKTLAEGTTWFEGSNQLGRDIVAVAVPSVIVPVWNVVIYPRAKRFWDHVTLASVEPFDYDARLFPDRTPLQDGNS